MSFSRSPIRAVALALIFSAGINAQSNSPSSADTLTIRSPNGRYAVQFSEPRSEATGGGRLWGKIAVRELGTGIDRAARVAHGFRGEAVFEGFSFYEQSSAWSPDGLYFAYWDDHCQSEPSIPGGVVCHLHEVHFLSMKSIDCRESLALSRYAFAGWARKEPHTVLEIPDSADGRTKRRPPCTNE